jgi:photosystem II stability/assembly factor-like uncharacterized protein
MTAIATRELTEFSGAGVARGRIDGIFNTVGPRSPRPPGRRPDHRIAFPDNGRFRLQPLARSAKKVARAAGLWRRPENVLWLINVRLPVARVRLSLLIAVFLAGCTATTAPGSPSSPPSSPASSPTHISLPTFAAVSAPSSKVVWMEVAGRVLFVSMDRAVTWSQRKLPPPSAFVQPEISFVSESEGWLLATGTVTAECGAQAIAIWHTSDGASTWRQLNPTGIADAQCKSGLSFTDSLHGFLVASDINRAPVIYRTGDGGKSWIGSHTLADPPGFTSKPGGSTLQPGRVASVGGTLLVAVTGISSQAVGQPPVHPAHTFVYGSDDGGATWRYRASAPDGGDPVAFITSTRWLQLKGSGEAHETLDVGVTWHGYTADYTQTAPMAPDVVFGDTVYGYATVQGTLERTLDGGAHWIPMPTPGT